MGKKVIAVRHIFLIRLLVNQRAIAALVQQVLKGLLLSRGRTQKIKLFHLIEGNGVDDGCAEDRL